MVVPEFLRTLVFARPRGDDQSAQKLGHYLKPEEGTHL